MEQQVREFGSLMELLEECDKHGMKPAEKAAAMERFIENKARRQGVPLRATLELTPLCNLDCKMCYVHLTKCQMASQPSGMLKGNQWIHIIRQAIDMGLMEVTLTGGEALLHPDFDEIFLFLEENNIDVNLKTNGILLTDERVAFLKKHHLGSVQLTLYGCDEESYERVTGHRGYAPALAAIKRLREAEIPLEIVITPSRYLADDLEKLLKQVHAMGIRYRVNAGLMEPLPETGRAETLHDLTLEQYIGLNKLMVKLHGITLTPMCAEELPQTGALEPREAKGFRCAAGRSTFSVSWQGVITPCRMFEKIAFDGLSLPLETIWKKLNAAVCEYPVPGECVGCQFEHVCPVCVIQHEYGAEPGHANPAICHRALRMAEEGLYARR